MNRREYIECLEQLLLVLPEEEREEAIQYYSDYFEDAGVENEDSVILELGSPEEVAAKIRAGYAGEYAEYSEAGYEDTRFQNNQEIITGYQNVDEGVNSEYKNSSYGESHSQRNQSSYGTDNSEWKDSVYEAEFQDNKESAQKQKSKNTNIWKIIAIGLILLIASPVILPLGIAGIAVVFSLIVALFAVIVSVGISGFAILLSGIIVIVAGIAKVLLTPAVGILAAGIGCILMAIGIIISWAMISLGIKVVPGMLRAIVNFLGTLFRKAGAK